MTISHIILGMPKSGKTTFLAALWHMISSGEIESKLKLDKLIGDHAHLNKIADAWRKCVPVARTSIASEKSVSIHLVDPETGVKSVISLPDLSGESYNEQVETRSCRKDYLKSFDSWGGVLLFVTADKISDGIMIQDILPLTEGLDTSTNNETPIITKEIKWQPKFIPLQVRLVELLQFLQNKPFPTAKRKLAIIVSAWDVLPEPKPTPQEWLKRELPLLHQFLLSNKDIYECNFYGVSALGGDIASGERNRLSNMVPSERITCVGPDGTDHDLSRPIIWLMSSKS